MGNDLNISLSKTKSSAQKWKLNWNLEFEIKKKNTVHCAHQLNEGIPSNGLSSATKQNINNNTNYKENEKCVLIINKNCFKTVLAN